MGLPPPRKCIINNGTKDFKIVTLSRFDYQKNMDLAFLIAEHFKGNPDIVFIWVGDGLDWKRLKDKAKDSNVNIQFVGFSSKPYQYLKMSDLYLSTSRFEGLPYALIEAQAFGLPIIATNVVGNDEVVEDTQNGYLFTDLDDAIQKIQKLYKNAECRRRMSDNASFSFQQKFTIDKMITNLMKVYKSVMKS